MAHTQQQLTLDEARTATEQGIAQAADNAGQEWIELAIEEVRRYALNHRTFLAEQVRLSPNDLPDPPHARAWGQVMLSAAKRGIIEKNGFGFARASHLSPVVKWKSLVFK